MSDALVEATDSSLQDQSTVITGARVVTPGGVLEDGWVKVSGAHLVAVGDGKPPPQTQHVAVSGWLLAGFVDLHVHGGGGRDASVSADDLSAAVAFHRAHGTTSTLVSLVTAPIRSLCEQLSRVADVVAGSALSGVLGAHLEGPFLSQARCGAQNPAHLRAPDRGVLRDLIAAGRGHLRSVTIAPELPGALELIDDLVAAGIVAAVGHTDATYEQTATAIARGATLATHLYNGMRPTHHREPGPVSAILESHAAFEVINDGVHLHPAIVRELYRQAPDRLVLVTDAMAAAGIGDGQYTLGGQDVVVTGAQARLVTTGGLAGSSLTMADAVRRAVNDGVDIVQVSRTASANPARVLGLHDRLGTIRPGSAADLVLLDEDLNLANLMKNGQWSSRPADQSTAAAPTTRIVTSSGG